jgi:small-conductance mechanosensitive channel
MKASHSKWLLILVFGLLGAMAYFGYHTQIKQLLDQPALSTKIAGFRISPYIIMRSVLTVIILFWIAGILNEFSLNKINALRGVKPATRTLAAKFIQIVIYMICVLTSLRVIGIDLTALAVFGGAVGIGLGVGLQKITANFISGLILLFEKSLQVGDLVELVDGTQGYVRFMGARYTLIETPDGKEIMIPNEDFITTRLINLTYNNKKAQIEIRLSVPFGADFLLAQRVMLEAAEQNPRALSDPAPQCFLNEFGESGALFILYFWVADVTEGRFSPKSDVMFSIWRKFREHGITFAQPHRTLYIHNQEQPIK